MNRPTDQCFGNIIAWISHSTQNFNGFSDLAIPADCGSFHPDAGLWNFACNKVWIADLSYLIRIRELSNLRDKYLANIKGLGCKDFF